MAVFATSGVDAPVREIAEKAGVGVGTFYRHFPQRADLIAAVFRREIDACADAAPVLAAEHEPGEALARWMQRYAAFIAAKRGLAKALHSGDPAFDNLPGYFDSDSGPPFAYCSRPRSPPARSAPMSMPTTCWARWRACACRPTMPDPAAPSAWSPSWSTGCATARGLPRTRLPSPISG